MNVTIEIEEQKVAQIHVLFKRLGFSTRKKFFYAIMEGLYREDDLLVEFLDSYVRENKIQSHNRRNKIKKLRDKGDKLRDEMSLNDNEIRNIYDIIEGEASDL